MILLKDRKLDKRNLLTTQIPHLNQLEDMATFSTRQLRLIVRLG